MTGKRGTPEERAGRYIVQDADTGCWIWIGSLSHGYGQINVNGRPAKAHRLMYELHKGPIPHGLSIDHLCRVRACVNPDHLEAVTLSENTTRQLRDVGHHNDLKTHCPKGHPYDEDNTRYASHGYGRVCRVCRAESNRKYREKKKGDKW